MALSVNQWPSVQFDSLPARTDASTNTGILLYDDTHKHSSTMRTVSTSITLISAKVNFGSAATRAIRGKSAQAAFSNLSERMRPDTHIEEG